MKSLEADEVSVRPSLFHEGFYLSLQYVLGSAVVRRSFPVRQKRVGSNSHNYMAPVNTIVILNL